MKGDLPSIEHTPVKIGGLESVSGLTSYRFSRFMTKNAFDANLEHELFELSSAYDLVKLQAYGIQNLVESRA
jgi:hypothetical protein